MNKLYSQNIYELLNDLYQRPSLYLGTNKSKEIPFSTLIAFISGFLIAQVNNTFELSLASDSPSYWEFSRWITAKVPKISQTLPYEWMIEEWGEQKAFDQFFLLLDEYKTCKNVYHCEAIVKGCKCKQYYNKETKLLETAEKPLKFVIGQYIPSEVYYLLEIYSNRQDKYFPYQNSLEEAKTVVESRWGILEIEWF